LDHGPGEERGAQIGSGNDEQPGGQNLFPSHACILNFWRRTAQPSGRSKHSPTQTPSRLVANHLCQRADPVQPRSTAPATSVRRAIVAPVMMGFFDRTCGYRRIPRRILRSASSGNSGTVCSAEVICFGGLTLVPPRPEYVEREKIRPGCALIDGLWARLIAEGPRKTP